MEIQLQPCHVGLFLEKLPPSIRAAFGATGELEQRLSRILAECREAWPDLCVEPAEFLPYLAERVFSETEGGLDRLRVADLYLAYACSQSSPDAIEVFEARFWPQVKTALHCIGAAPAQVQEVKQILWVKLFVSVPEGQPGIAHYSGRGPLAGWVRVAAVRTAARLLRHELRAGTGQEHLLEALSAPGHDPEAAYLEGESERELRRALELAVGKLPPRARIVLRLHYGDGLSIDAMAELLGVHRATAARWVAKAVDELFLKVRHALMRCLRVPPSEIENTLRQLSDQVHLSLDEILPPVIPPDAPVHGVERQLALRSWLRELGLTRARARAKGK